jgi:ribonuclease-3
VQSLLRHRFHNPRVLLQALTHSSYSNELMNLGASSTSLPDNERLEFLGDAVIGLVVANQLMERFPEACEGALSRWRSNLVSRKTLAEIAAGLGLGDHLLLGRGERRTGGAEKRSILAAALEALVGAMYVDGGLGTAEIFLGDVYRPFFDHLASGEPPPSDNKTHLQERTQSRFKMTPVYRLIDAWGPEHQKTFRVEIIIDGKVVASGEGGSKKEAEQRAASLALEILGF